MSIEAGEVRCSACGSLLGRLEKGALVVQRGDLQVRMVGDVSAELTCYRRSCRRQTVVRIFSEKACHSDGREAPLRSR
jgi:hypothetical protein